jgi:hypothetical protein
LDILLSKYAFFTVINEDFGALAKSAYFGFLVRVKSRVSRSLDSVIKYAAPFRDAKKS